MYPSSDITKPKLRLIAIVMISELRILFIVDNLYSYQPYNSLTDNVTKSTGKGRRMSSGYMSH